MLKAFLKVSILTQPETVNEDFQNRLFCLNRVSADITLLLPLRIDLLRVKVLSDNGTTPSLLKSGLQSMLKAF